MAKILQNQIDSLLTGEGRYLSVHEQWEIAQSLKRLKAIADALKAERAMLGQGEENYLPLFEKTQKALAEIARDHDEQWPAHSGQGEK